MPQVVPFACFSPSLSVFGGDSLMLQVSEDFRLALAAIFSTGWRIAVAFKIPGTNINIPEFCLAGLVLCLVLRRGPRLLGLGPWADHDIVHPEFMSKSRESGAGRSNYSDRNTSHGNM